MKIILFAVAVAATILTGLITSGCQSASTPDEKAAQAKVDEAKQELKAAEKAATAEEWMTFKAESEAKIRINEISITEYKDKRLVSESKLDAVYSEKIDNLEKQNRNLKTRIEAYENRKSNWESFKKEFNHDLDELGKALRELANDSKK